jgi:dicarboxylate transporter 10
MAETSKGPRRVAKWYFGGIASAMAACFTHPFDLLKVHLQTQQGTKIGLLTMGVKVVKTDGPLALWNGISASLLRQMTYSLVRCVVVQPKSKTLVW